MNSLFVIFEIGIVYNKVSGYLFVKFSKDSYWFKSGMLSLLHRLSVVILGLLTFIILIRIFTKEDYGVWMLFISISTIFEVLRNGFIRNPLVKYVNTSDRVEYTKVISSALYLNFAFTLVTSALLFLSAEWAASFLNAPVLASVLKIYIITNFALIPFSHFEFIQQSNFTFLGTFISYLIRYASLFVYVLFCYFSQFHLDIHDLAYLNAGSIMVGALVSFFFARKYLIFQLRPDIAWIIRLFHYGKFTFGTNVNSILFKNMDHWLLGHLISPVSVAIYNPAVRISNLVEVPTMSLSAILFPKIAEHSGDYSRVKKLYERSVGAILALIVPVSLFIFIFADWVVLILAGEGYRESVPVLRITLFNSLYIPFLRFFGNVLDAVNHPHVNFYFVLFLALFNTLIGYLLIGSYGVIGAAYATLITFGLGFLINQIYLRINFKISTWNCVKEAFIFYALGFKMVYDFIARHLNLKTLN